MCNTTPSDLAHIIATTLGAAPAPLTTQQIEDALLARGLCRFHIRHAFRIASDSGAIRPNDAAPADPWTGPGRLWTASAEGDRDDVEVLVPGRWVLPLPRKMLGRGGNGIVLLGRQEGFLERPVAIKLLAPELVRITEGHSDEWRQIVREIKVLARLSHPNIITVYDGGLVPATKAPFLAMELVEWPTLFTLIQERGPLPPLLVARILRGALAGLDYAYSRAKLFHRDIKPANLFVNVELLLVKVADFGLACFDEGSVNADGTSTSISRASPGLLGTPAYHAPERYTWAKGDQRSDLYSLGMTGYAALTGHSPFPNLVEGQSTVMEWVDAHNNVDTRAVHLRHHSMAPGCPPRLADFIHRMIRRDPKERPQTHQEAILELDRLIRDLEPSSTRLHPTVRANPSTPEPRPSAAESEVARLLDQVAPSSPASDIPDPSRLAHPLPTFVPEDLAALSNRMVAIENRYGEMFHPDALYYAKEPLLLALSKRAQKLKILPVYRDIFALDTEEDAPQFEDWYCQRVAGHQLPEGAPDIPITPCRYFYDAHSLALHSPDPTVALRAKGLAEAVLGFLGDALENPELLALRKAGREKSSPAESATPVPVAPAQEASVDQPSPAASPAETSPATATIGPGVRLDHLTITRELGKGGYGTVYLAHDDSLDRPVAVKVLTPASDPKQQEENRRFFERELKIASRLRHPNVVQVYSTFLHRGVTPCLVMEYVEGTSLALQLLSLRKYSEIEALEIARQVAQGLAHAHEAGLVHRDIKPDNVLLDLGGRAVITDFGLMKSVRVTGGGAGPAATAPLTFLGTPHYCSPEQARAEAVDLRTDIYSLGATLYELLSGVRPFVGNTEMSVLHQIANHDILPRPLADHVPGMDPEVAVLVDQMMAKRPEERFQSCENVIAAIGGILIRLHRQPKGAGRSPNKRRLLWALAGALLVGAIAFALTSRPKSPPAPPSKDQPLEFSITPPPTPVPPAPFPPEDPPKTAQLPKPVDPPTPAVKTDTPEYILKHHSPSKEELELLEKYLAINRGTLPARSEYRFDEALAKTASFQKDSAAALSPWLTLIVAAGNDSLAAASKAFAARPFFKKDEPLAIIVLRNGTTLRGKVISEEGDEVTVEPPGSLRSSLRLGAVAPSTFSSAALAPYEGIQLRFGAGDATGALAKLGDVNEGGRRRLLPLILDQAIEETLQAAYRENDLTRLLALQIPEAYQDTAGALIPTRVQVLLVEQEAARLYRKKSDKEADKRLLSDLSTTAAGALYAKETLEAFRKALAQGAEAAGLIHAPKWESAAAVPDRCSFIWKNQEVYTLAAPDAHDWIWIQRDHEGAKAGYVIHWTFADPGSETAHLWIAPYTPAKGIRIEIGIREVVLRQLVLVDGKPTKELVLRTIDLPSPVAEGSVAIVPHDGTPLLYLNDRFLFALPALNEDLPGKIYLGCSEGGVTVHSVRVVDPKAY